MWGRFLCTPCNSEWCLRISQISHLTPVSDRLFGRCVSGGLLAVPRAVGRQVDVQNVAIGALDTLVPGLIKIHAVLDGQVGPQVALLAVQKKVVVALFAIVADGGRAGRVVENVAGVEGAWVTGRLPRLVLAGGPVEHGLAVGAAGGVGPLDAPALLVAQNVLELIGQLALLLALE